MTMPFAQWWSGRISRGIDHREVVGTVRADAGWSSHFAFMTLMSAGIAVLGLLLSSPAVVIGAMLLSPLMGPIIGIGFALATFDAHELRRTGWALGVGVILAVLFCALIVAVSPLQSVTSEISSRTKPNLFDLLVALFSGLAGTYAMIRGRQGTIVGVAIATALMPPLAVMGFGLATMNWPVFGGASLLFFTNLMTIAASTAVLARVYGFATGLSPHQTRLQATLITGTLIALAVPLGFSLHRIAWEALAGREISAAIAAGFPDGARVNDLSIDFHSNPIEVSATVLTPTYREAGPDLSNKLSLAMGHKVAMTLDQIRTEDGSQAATESAAAAGATAAQLNAARIAERLSLVAGVPIGNVIVDRSSRRAIVRAKPLPDASFEAYRMLETRVAQGSDGWNVILIPPLVQLPAVPITDGQPDEKAIDTAIWASTRLGLAVAISGGSEEEANIVATALQKSGAKAQIIKPRNPGTVELRWAIPSSGAEAKSATGSDKGSAPAPATKAN